jgi:hypothetical protein
MKKRSENRLFSNPIIKGVFILVFFFSEIKHFMFQIKDRQSTRSHVYIQKVIHVDRRLKLLSRSIIQCGLYPWL